MNNPYEWLQNFIQQVPDILQPLMVAVVAMIPYIEGEAAAAFGIIAGINPIVAAISAAAGNILCVVGVVFLGSKIRERIVARRAAKKARTTGERSVIEGAETKQSIATGRLREASNTALSDATSPAAATVAVLEQSGDDQKTKTDAREARREKGRARLRRWTVRFGVPGASILAPLVLPTMLTAAFFVASGVSKQWVILWQAVAIVLWTGAVAFLAAGAIALLGW